MLCTDGNEETPLHVALNCDTVTILLKHGCNINAVNEQGNTPLHRAICRRNMGVSKYLIDHGADVNVKNCEGQTPLHHAVEAVSDEDMEEIIELLIKAGVDVNAADVDGKTPLHYTCSIYKAKHYTALLLAKGARLDLSDSKGDYSIHHCINMMHMIKDEDFNNVVGQLMLSADMANLGDARGRTALHILAAGTNVELIESVIKAGGDINKRDNSDKTPLHYVSEQTNENCIAGHLVDCGAVIDARDAWERTPLMIAVEKESKHCVQQMIAKGANLYHADNCGITALHIACYRDAPELVDLLIKNGANVNAIDADGSSPLHAAAFSGSTNSVDMLVKAGSTQDLVDKLNRSAFDVAMMKGYFDITGALTSTTETETTRKFSSFAKEMIDLETAQNLIAEKTFKRTLKNKRKYVQNLLQTPFTGRGADDQEAKEIQQIMEDTIQTLARIIGETDPRFRCTVLHAGSSSEGTKTKCPDEFDFMVCLEEFSNMCEPPKFQTEDKMFEKSLNIPQLSRVLDPVEDSDSLQVEELIISISDYADIQIKDTPEAKPFRTFSCSAHLPCYKMYVGFSKLVERVLFHVDFPKHPRLIPINVTLDPALTFHWRGAMYKDMVIDVDFVPAIRLPSWSDKVDRSSPILTEDLVKLPYLAVPKMTSSQDENLWRCSLSLVESAIFRKLRPDVRNSYIACKAMVSSSVLPQISFPGGHEDEMEYLKFMHGDSFDEDLQIHDIVESVVPSYILKMTFLSLIEERVRHHGVQDVFIPPMKPNTVEKAKTDANSSEPAVKLQRQDVSQNDPDNTKHGNTTTQTSEMTSTGSIDDCFTPSMYGPALHMNVTERDLDFDLEIVCQVFQRLENFLRDRFVPSVFNRRHNVLGHSMMSGDADKALVFIQLINELLEDE